MPTGWRSIREVRMEVHRRRHSVVRAKRAGARLQARRAAHDGRIWPPDSRTQSISIFRKRGWFQAAGRLRSQQGTEVRHSYHARNSAPGGREEPSDQRHVVSRGRNCRQGQSLPSGIRICRAWTRPSRARKPITIRSRSCMRHGAWTSSRPTIWEAIFISQQSSRR